MPPNTTGNPLLYIWAALPRYRAIGASTEAGMTVEDAPYILLERDALKPISAGVEAAAWVTVFEGSLPTQ